MKEEKGDRLVLRFSFLKWKEEEGLGRFRFLERVILSFIGLRPIPTSD
jgi:hypothetical protein